MTDTYTTNTEIPTLTPDEIKNWYDLSMACVNSINTIANSESISIYDIDGAKRMAEHLEIMLSKDWWTTEDLTPFEQAIQSATNPPLEVKVIPVAIPEIKTI